MKKIANISIVVIAILSSAISASAWAKAPSATTLPASGITSNSAVLNGYFNPNGDASSAWFEYNSQKYGIKNNISGNSPVSISFSLSGLDPNKTYSFMLASSNKNGTTYGKVLTFRTKAGSQAPGAAVSPSSSPNASPSAESASIASSKIPLPAVSTDIAFSVGAYGATLGGYWQGDGVTTWFEYGNSMSLNNKTIPVLQKSKPGFISAKVSGSSNTTYYFRLAAKNAGGTSYGLINSFRTSTSGDFPNYAAVSTGDASNVSGTSARLNGFIDPNGSGQGYWFEYGNDPRSFSNATAISKLDPKHPTAVSADLANLNPATTYYFRLAGQNNYGIARGETLRFDTQGTQYAQAGAASAILSSAVLYSKTVNLMSALFIVTFSFFAVRAFRSKAK